MAIAEERSISLDELDRDLGELHRLEQLGTDGDVLIGLHRFVNRVSALISAKLERFDHEQGYQSEGAISVADWLRHRCRLTGEAARDEARTARRLEELPAARESFERGDISFRHASLVAETIAKVGNQPNPEYSGEPGEARNLEETLVGNAEEFNPYQLRQLCTRAKLCFDPDGALQDWERQEARQYLECSKTIDGLLHVQGLLAPEGAEVALTALDAAMPPPAEDDKRGAAERRAEALVSLLRMALDKGQLPTHDAERPHLALIVDYASLRGEPGEAAILDRTGEPVPGKVAERLACDCIVTPIVRGEDGDVLHVGKKRRLFSPKQSLALALRDRHCVFPGCARPSPWCANHHLISWLRGGNTDLDNAGKLCKRHHALCHEGGWTLRRDPTTGVFAADPPP